MSAQDNDSGDDSPKELAKPKFVPIKELEPETMGFSIHCRVFSVKRKLCREQLNGDIVRIYEAVVYDDSAAITMTLKGEDQISAVKEGDNLTLRNVKVSMHNFHMRLACDRWGLIEKDNESRIKPNMDDDGNEKAPQNVSDQEYERVDDSVGSDVGNNNNNRSRGGSPQRRRGGRGRGRGRRGGRGRGRGGYGGQRRSFGGPPRRSGPPFRGGRGGGRGRPGGGRRGGRGGPRRGPPRSPPRGYNY